MKSLNKKINCRLASLCIPALFLAATDAFPETVNLYWSGGNASSDLNVTQANNWSVSPTEWTPPEKMDLANNILIFDKATKNHWEPNIARASVNTSTVIAGIVNSYRTEYHVNTNGGIKVSGNYDIDVTQQLSSDGTIVKGVRFALGTGSGNDFLNVGGDMNINTGGYLHTIVSNVSSEKRIAYSLTVGGALSFTHSGNSGYHVFNVRENFNTDIAPYSTFTANLGGLSSDKAVLFTAGISVAERFVFQNAADGSFKGGDFKGVFANASGVSSDLSFEMNADGRQSISIYKASNTATHGIENSPYAKEDATISSISVMKGDFIINTELAVGNISMSGGKLGFSSDEKVGTLTINGGELLFGKTIAVGDLILGVEKLNIVFNTEDISANGLTVLTYDHIDIPVPVEEMFVAYDISGNALGGEFSIVGEAGGPGSIMYTIPEPAEVAAFFGIMALAVSAFYRRRAK